MTLAPTTTITRSERAIHRELSGGGRGGVLLNLDTGAYYELKPIGLLVWTMLDEESNFERLIARLRGELDEPPPELDAEIGEFLRRLEERQLVVIRT
jgi:Coenzyme PQQ synthesis protein D (PqqD)